jgi:hypothetical protein
MNRRLIPFTLLGILTLGAAAGAAVSLAEWPITHTASAPTAGAGAGAQSGALPVVTTAAVTGNYSQ